MRFPGGASPSQFTRFTNQKKQSPNGSSHRTHAWELYGRMKRVARSHRAPARVRATTASFRAPASDFSPSLSLFGFVSKERRGTFLRFASSCPRFVHTGRRTRSIHFMSFIHSFRPRSSPPGTPAPAFARAHPREHVIFGTRSPRGGVAGVGQTRTHAVRLGSARP